MSAFERDLGSLPFFAGLDPTYVRLISDCASQACFEPGDYIFQQGRQADRFYIIEEGRVALEIFSSDRGVLTIQTLAPGEVVGASWLFPPYVWQYDARALQYTRTAAFNAVCLRAACDGDHDLGYDLMKRFAKLMVERLNATRFQLLDVYANPASG